MIGRLPRSRSPPQPNTQTSLPRGEGPQRVEHVRQRVGLVGVVDEDERAVALARPAPAGPSTPVSCARAPPARAARPRPRRSPGRPRPARWTPGSRRPAAARPRCGAPSCLDDHRPLPKPLARRATLQRAASRPRARRSAASRPRAAGRLDRPASACSPSALITAVAPSGSSASNSRSLAVEIVLDRRDDSRGGRGRDW